jgi:hypothetical protein
MFRPTARGGLPRHRKHGGRKVAIYGSTPSTQHFQERTALQELHLQLRRLEGNLYTAASIERGKLSTTHLSTTHLSTNDAPI